MYFADRISVVNFSMIEAYQNVQDPMQPDNIVDAGSFMGGCHPILFLGCLCGPHLRVVYKIIQ